eukprot:TRINITY_DN4633_c1_g1_i1.p1 TRINITY_DN4633_c1_g1~~TRINITY_DN4633_c1_g1_i1.p1  ORF type:complete len:345 (-),score=67.26 TRINITY_DN4633_c1_g1_i1:697-1731(-)
MATTFPNRQILLKSYPEGMVTEDCMEFNTSGTISADVAKGSKDVLVQNLYVSVDPYLRGRMSPEGVSYAPGFPLGKPIINYAVSKVVASDNPEFSVGDNVEGWAGWEDYTLFPEGKGLTKISPKDGVPLSYYLGVLGMPGMTAYFGFNDICSAKKGETFFVSAASGAVGQIVGQLAKLEGCHVVGCAGSAEKVTLLKEKFGYDEAFNYKDEPDLGAALKRCCPKGIDIYFENVGGKMLDAVLGNMNLNGRIAVCGMIAQYNVKDEPIHNLIHVLFKRLKIQGFIVLDFASRAPEFMGKMVSLVQEKKITYVEDVSEGLERTPAAFVGLYSGNNVGKAVVKVASP